MDDLTRTYSTTEADPVALAKALGVSIDRVGLRLGVTGRWAREMAHSPRHAGRVRRVVLEVALENERLEALL